MHFGLTGISEYINKIRLKTYDSDGYFNSGVLLFNLSLQREQISKESIFSYVRQHETELVFPDQDVLNALFYLKILSLDDSLYNYNTCKCNSYLLTSNGEKDMDWVMKNTVILHFCGTRKPWKKGY